jgi:hypothetical protein
MPTSLVQVGVVPASQGGTLSLSRAFVVVIVESCDEEKDVKVGERLFNTSYRILVVVFIFWRHRRRSDTLLCAPNCGNPVPSGAAGSGPSVSQRPFSSLNPGCGS